MSDSAQLGSPMRQGVDHLGEGFEIEVSKNASATRALGHVVPLGTAEFAVAQRAEPRNLLIDGYGGSPHRNIHETLLVGRHDLSE